MSNRKHALSHVNTPAKKRKAGSQQYETTREEIKQGLLQSPPKYTLQACGKNKSSAYWINYQLICDAETKKNVDFVRCTICDTILHYTSNTGTGSVMRHAETCSNATVECTSNTATEKAKRIFKAAEVEFCGRDLHSFRSVEGHGFRAIVQAAIDIGAEEGKVDATRLITGRKSIRTEIHAFEDKHRPIMQAELQAAKKESGLVAGVDHWKDKSDETQKVSLAFAFMCSDFNIRMRMYDLRSFPYASKTAINNRQCLSDMFHEIGLDMNDKRVMFVHDEGRDVEAALRDTNHYRCAGHLICTAHRRCFQLGNDGDVLDDEQVSAVLDSDEDTEDTALNQDGDAAAKFCSLVKICHATVSHFKRSTLNNELRRQNVKTLKHFSQTRWNGILKMLESVLHSYDKCLELLSTHKPLSHYNKLRTVSKNDLADIVAFLKPFEQATSFLESDNITLPFVVPYFDNLIRSCAANSDDAPVVAVVKKRMEKEMKRKLTSLSAVHYLATMLHPCFKSTGVVKDTDIEAATSFLFAIDGDSDAENNVSVEEDKTSLFACHNLADEPMLGTLQAEWDAYRSLKVGRCAPEKFALSQFWMEQKTTLPKLTNMARFILAAPACSAMCERVHSTGKFAHPITRSSMKSETLRSLVFFHCYGKEKF